MPGSPSFIVLLVPVREAISKDGHLSSDKERWVSWRRPVRHSARAG